MKHYADRSVLASRDPESCKIRSFNSSQDPYLLSQTLIENNLRKLQKKHKHHDMIETLPRKVYRTEQQASEYMNSGNYHPRVHTKSFEFDKFSRVNSSASKPSER